MTAIMVGDKLVGLYDEEKHVFSKFVKRSMHFMIKHDGWGVDKSVLNRLAADNATIRIEEQEAREAFIVSANEWKNTGIEEDFGYGVQVFLPESKMAKGKL